MTFGFLVLAFVVVTNPARVGLALTRPESLVIGYGALLAGSALVFGATVLLATFSGTLLGGLQVSPETFALSAAAVMAVMALRVVAFPGVRNMPVLDGLRAALVPVSIPLLFTPELFMLTVTAASLEGVGEAVGAAAVAFALVLVGVALARRAPRRIAVDVLARLIAAGAVVVAVAIALDAIYDV